MVPGIRTACMILVAALATVAGTIVPSWAQSDSAKPAVIVMDDERIRLSGIELRQAGPASIARRLTVPGTIVPDAGRVAHVSIKVSGTVADLRKNIGDDVQKDEVLGVLESREVADAKSEYLSAKLSNELQQDLTARDKSLWEGRAVPEQQYIKSRNAAAQTEMRFGIARQKLTALGVSDAEVSGLPQAPDGTLRSQNVRAPISGRIVERKVELGTAVGRDSLETELFVIVDLSRVWVDLAVSATDLPLVREGQDVAVAVRGITETGSGNITFVTPCWTRRPARPASWSRSTMQAVDGVPVPSSRRRSRSKGMMRRSPSPLPHSRPSMGARPSSSGPRKVSKPATSCSADETDRSSRSSLAWLPTRP